MQSLPDRSTVDKKYRWNDEAVFADSAAWKREYEAVSALLPSLAARAGTLGDGPAALLDFLILNERTEARVETLAFYATMRGACDSGDEEAQSLSGRAGALSGRYAEAVAFLEPELLALGEATIAAWMAENGELAAFGHWFDDLFRLRSHVRSAEVEAVLGAAQEVFAGAASVHDMLVDSDLTFADARDSAGNAVPVEQSTIDTLLGSPDRALRKSAWESYCDAHLAFAPSLAASLVTDVKKDCFLARARGYGSSLEAALSADNIPLATFETTLAVFEKNRPLWHRYWKARAKALGQQKMSHWDIWAPLSKNPPKVPFETAVDWICEALSPLGEPYVERLRRGCLEERWVDAYPTKGKSQGAFSYGSRATAPYIMMSYADDLSSLSTLTHELGHSMHSALTRSAQRATYADYGIFAAEVASNFHQAMTRDYLFRQNADRDFQIALIEEAMENFHRYFFIMPTLALFERETHRRVWAGEGPTATELNELTADLFAAGYGDAVEVDREREGSTWAQFGHLYMNFYVFQYATGISAAHALSGPILAGDRDAAKRYVEFLSAGDSLYPVDALRRAGVDMTGPAAMEAGFRTLESLVSRFESLI